MFDLFSHLDFRFMKPLTDGRGYANRANRHNKNLPGPGGKNYPGRGKPIRPGTHAVYPHSSTRQQQRYARQRLAAELKQGRSSPVDNRHPPRA